MTVNLKSVDGRRDSTTTVDIDETQLTAPLGDVISLSLKKVEGQLRKTLGLEPKPTEEKKAEPVTPVKVADPVTPAPVAPTAPVEPVATPVTPAPAAAPVAPVAPVEKPAEKAPEATPAAEIKPEVK